MMGFRKIQVIRLIVIVSVCILIPSLSLRAQSLKIKAVLDSAQIMIGDQVKLHLEVDQPKNAKVSFPVFKDTLSGKIEVVQTLKRDTSLNGTNIHVHQAYVITCYDSGSYQINTLALPFQLGSVHDTLRSVALNLKVNTLPVDTTKEIKDIKSPYKARFSIFEIWLPIVIGLGILLIIFIVWYVLKSRKKGNFLFSPKPYIPSHVLALQELDNLRSEKLWQNNKVKLYYTRLTEIIRNYIENRYDINALEMTSDEILDALKGLKLEDHHPIELLQNMFSIADMVKFAKAEPFPEENEIGLLNAYQFINNTKPVETINTDEKIQPEG